MRNVLIVDVSATQALTLKRLLNRHGYRARVAEEAGKAWRMIRDEQPDLVVVDHSPSGVTLGLDGIEMTGELARSPLTAHIPVVVMAPRGQTSNRIRAFWQGARGYLSKPIDENELLCVLRSLLDTEVREAEIA